MSSTINKIKIINFKRFRNYTIELNKKINIFVGDNESGKSTIIDAIDLVVNGNIRFIEAIGLDRLINVEAVKEFNSGDRAFRNLPLMIIELYLDGCFDYTMNGKNNTEQKECDGIRLVCEADDDYRNEINQILSSNKDYFPYEYYKIRFTTFMDESYTHFKKKIRSVKVDSLSMKSDYATSSFVHNMYNQYTEINIGERINHRSMYRKMREEYNGKYLQDINKRVEGETNYTFGLKIGTSVDFESNLMIYENGVGIDSKGTGTQVFMKTDFALRRAGENIDVILIEEPENHLSHTNLRRLIQLFVEKQECQLFITTHNNLISTRLELHNIFILHKNDDKKPATLKELDIETAKYFIKAPPANIIEFALSEKVILVEGPSEYMLLEKFYKIFARCLPEYDMVHIIDIHGLSFKRYLDIAKITGAKVAIITDNDGNAQVNCIDKYINYQSTNNIKVFFEEDNSKKTFEIVFYNDNKRICDQLFGEKSLEYMLNNKTESAYKVLSSDEDLTIPKYIERAIAWIKE